MFEQVSLLSNKMQHLKVCKTLRKLRFDEVNNNVRRRIARVSTKSIQVQAG